MILCCGEILADMIAERKNEKFCYIRKAGGAPFNVACAINRYNGQSAFVGAVGSDTIGDFLVRFCENQKLSDYYIFQHKHYNTTLAFVDIDDYGERSFCFYRKNTADYHMPEVSNEMLEKANIVHIGSLMLSEKQGYQYALELAKRAKLQNKLVSFDINYRTDIFSDSKEAISRYKEVIELSDIVKFSEEELEIFGSEYLEKISNNRLVCISLGSKGSMYKYNTLSEIIPSIKVKPIDTTGAGDSFYAGILCKIDGLNKSEWTKEVLNEAFRFANICGALNTLGKGAIDHLPTYEEVMSHYQEI